MKPNSPTQQLPNQPDKEFFKKNPGVANEWHRAYDLLFKANLVTSMEYPDIHSVRWDTSSPLNTLIDHTLLKQSARTHEYQTLCEQAKLWGTKSVCVPPNRAPLVKKALLNSSVLVCSVVGFPFGYDSTKAKVEETHWLIQEGVDEIDMVVPVGWIKDGEYELVFQDIRSVVMAAQGKLVKVILETSELTDQEKVAGSTIAFFAGAHFLKTSTGFASGGADLESLAIMRAVAGPLRGIKASGGVRTRDFALQCISLGIDRIGTSSAAAILGISDQKGSDY